MRCWRCFQLTLHDHNRAWKGFDWAVLDRLHERGLIHDPVGKVKSVVLASEGMQRSQELFEAMFVKQDGVVGRVSPDQ